jgi:transketolase
MFKLRENTNVKGRELRLSVVETLLDMMDHDNKVMALEADLGGASYFNKIEQAKKDNFIQCGISEANMIGTAAGLSAVGIIPFVHTFAPFATRRCFDQVYMSGAYAKNTVNIYGSDPGFCAGPNGGTHTSWEDVAMMRTIPDAVVCDGADDTQVEWIIREFAKTSGVHYLRANRKAVNEIYEKGSTFEIGKGNLLTKGNEVLIISTGQLVKEALDASKELEAEGYSVSVVDMFCIKPLDNKIIIDEARNKKVIVTFENHSIIGGLGSAVSEVIAENGISTKFKRIGANDVFGQVGSQDYLQKEFGLTKEHLVKEIKALLNK